MNTATKSLPVRNRVLFWLCAFLGFLVWCSSVNLVQFEYYDKCLPTLLADDIVSVDPNRIEPANEGRMVYLEGEISVDEVLRDPLFGVEARAAVLFREVRTKGRTSSSAATPADYQMPMVYRADSRNCRLGAYGLRDVDKDWHCSSLPLTEKNIPDSLKGRAFLTDIMDGEPREIHIQEADGSTTIVSFMVSCAPPTHWGQLVGRQHGEDVVPGYFCFYTKEDYEALPYTRIRNPREYYAYPVYSLCDICLRMGFAFLLATFSAYFCFYFIRKAFSHGSKQPVVFLIFLSVFLTLAFFLWALWYMMERGIECDGYHLQKTQLWIGYCKWGLAISAACFVLTLLCMALRRILRR